MPYIDESPTMSPQLSARGQESGDGVSPTPADGLSTGVGGLGTKLGIRTCENRGWDVSSFLVMVWCRCDACGCLLGFPNPGLGMVWCPWVTLVMLPETAGLGAGAQLGDAGMDCCVPLLSARGQGAAVLQAPSSGAWGQPASCTGTPCPPLSLQKETQI